ncbi:ImuA family protein [Shewanella algae]|uniref:ImuA family protein n=1 Tax=Shewanella algae TaxID=38313 RepID=UPI003AAC5366
MSLSAKTHSVKSDPAKSQVLNGLLERRDLWLGPGSQGKTLGYPSGFEALDAQLSDAGWPRQGICELFSQSPGHGELSLLLPLMRYLLPAQCGSHSERNHSERSQSKRNQSRGDESRDAMIMLIAPPLQPLAQSFAQHGIAAERILWLELTQRKEVLWAMEQGLSSGACPLVLSWLDKLTLSEARRLQLAAEQGKALGICQLPMAQADSNHPVTLKLAISAAGVNTARLQILKRRGGWPVPELHLRGLPALALELPHVEPGVVTLRNGKAGLNHSLSNSTDSIEPNHSGRKANGTVLHGSGLHGTVLHGSGLHGTGFHSTVLHGPWGMAQSRIAASNECAPNPWTARQESNKSAGLFQSANPQTVNPQTTQSHTAQSQADQSHTAQSQEAI